MHPQHVPGKINDHIVIIQLVEVALNKLPSNSFERTENWQRQVIDLLNNRINMQLLTPLRNERKRQVVWRLIHEREQKKGDFIWIQQIRNTWRKLRLNLHNAFEVLIAEMDYILST